MEPTYNSYNIRNNSNNNLLSPRSNINSNLFSPKRDSYEHRKNNSLNILPNIYQDAHNDLNKVEKIIQSRKHRLEDEIDKIKFKSFTPQRNIPKIEDPYYSSGNNGYTSFSPKVMNYQIPVPQYPRKSVNLMSPRIIYQNPYPQPQPRPNPNYYPMDQTRQSMQPTMYSPQHMQQHIPQYMPQQIPQQMPINMGIPYERKKEKKNSSIHYGEILALIAALSLNRPQDQNNNQMKQQPYNHNQTSMNTPMQTNQNLPTMQNGMQTGMQTGMQNGMQTGMQNTNYKPMSIETTKTLSYTPQKHTRNFSKPKEDDYNKRKSSEFDPDITDYLEDKKPLKKHKINDKHRSTPTKKYSNFMQSGKSLNSNEGNVKHRKSNFTGISNISNYKKPGWNSIINWIQIHRYYLIIKRYTSLSNTRNKNIILAKKEFAGDLDIIKTWLKFVQEEFLSEIQFLTEINVSFNNKSGTFTIDEQSKKIIALINKLIKCLMKSSYKGMNIPEKVHKVIFKYIKNHAYYPKSYLTTFEVQRLDFDFMGATQYNDEFSTGMLLALLILSRTLILQIFLHPIENYPELKHVKGIEEAFKYIGSILHYLIRDSFKATPAPLQNIIILHNYYKNYHIFNDALSKKQKEDDYFNNPENIDVDEISTLLIKESTISTFFDINSKWATEIKDNVFQWAVSLGKFIKSKNLSEEKFSKFGKKSTQKITKKY